MAAGTRGLIFTSALRLDADDRETRARAAAVREMNLRLEVLEPWGAAGRFAAQAQTSSNEVQAYVMEASRARMVLAWRCVQGAQIVAQVDIVVVSNWPGTVYSYVHSGPKAPVLRTRPAIEISWASQTGHTYQVQRCTNLVEAVWHNLGLPVFAQGTNSFVLDTMPDTNATYRLQLLD